MNRLVCEPYVDEGIRAVLGYAPLAGRFDDMAKAITTLSLLPGRIE